jgi:type II secretory ATPase GspE/PulE/Tfp pilus assembly ATPase PilB-like protein
VRLLCRDCKQPYEPSPEERERLKLGQDLIYKAKGCEKCNHIGYRGRMCVCEVLPVNEPIRNLIVERADSHKIKETARSHGMSTLTESALFSVKQGLTSLEEAFSVMLIEE